MITQYIERAMEHAQIERLPESGDFYGSIPGLAGVWATGPTPEACRAELRSVLEGWIAVGLSQHCRLPEVDGIDINIEAAEAVG